MNQTPSSICAPFLKKYDINEKFESILREYIVVGRMPEAVQKFVGTKDFNEVQIVQEKILNAYDDIALHAKGSEKVKVRACYDSLPRQLAKENKKFKYSEGEKRATLRKYGDSITWLKDSNLVHVCYNAYEPYLSLVANSKNDEFKRKVFKGTRKAVFIRMSSRKCSLKAAIISTIITQNSSMELELLIEKDGEVVPVEVKAGNSSTASLNHFIGTFHPSVAYKLIDGNIGTADGKVTLPHYMAMFI